MDGEFYYIDAGGQQVGPLSWAVLEQLVQAETITDATMTAPAGGQWQSFAELKKQHTQHAVLPPVPTGDAKGRTDSRNRVPLIVMSTAAMIIMLAVIVVLNSKRPAEGKPNAGQSAVVPEHVPEVIESMPKLYLPVPGSNIGDGGVMLVFTGENSVHIRAVPDHPGLFQIDAIRYAVVYENLPDSRTRNALTLVLNLGTRFEDGKWQLLEARGSSHDEISKPGGAAEKKVNEAISSELAMWHGEWIIRHLNRVPSDPDFLSRNMQRYNQLEQGFMHQHNMIEGMRAQGVQLPAEF